MKAANLHGINDLRYEDIEKAVCEEDEVMVELKSCGICGSDIPRVFTKGTYHFPTVIGHEFSGVVTEDKSGEFLGKRVAVFPLLPCFKCDACKEENYAACSDYDYYGSRRDGAFAEYLAVDKRNLVLLDDSISFAEASLLEPAAVARAAIRRMQITLGDTVVIFGAGPIGLVAAQWAKKAGAGLVRVVDISEEKLAFAREFGFEAYDAERDGPCQCALEGTGASAALNNAVKALAPNGRLVLMGNPFGDMCIDRGVYSEILRREITMCGTWNSSYNDRVNDWRAVADAMAGGDMVFEPLITHRFPLEKCNEALEMMRDKTEFFTKVTFVAKED